MDDLKPVDWFTNRDPMEPAKTDDLILLLESVSTHYKMTDGMVQDITDAAADDLIAVFDAMCTHYTIGDGWNHEEAPELWSLFDYLAEVFG